MREVARRSVWPRTAIAGLFGREGGNWEFSCARSFERADGRASVAARRCLPRPTGPELQLGCGIQASSPLQGGWITHCCQVLCYRRLRKSGGSERPAHLPVAWRRLRLSNEGGLRGIVLEFAAPAAEVRVPGSMAPTRDD